MFEGIHVFFILFHYSELIWFNFNSIEIFSRYHTHLQFLRISMFSDLYFISKKEIHCYKLRKITVNAWNLCWYIKNILVCEKLEFFKRYILDKIVWLDCTVDTSRFSPCIKGLLESNPVSTFLYISFLWYVAFTV